MFQTFQTPVCHRRRIDATRRFIACNQSSKKCLTFTETTLILHIKQKLFSCSCFKRVSDVYLIRYKYKLCNTTHIFYV